MIAYRGIGTDVCITNDLTYLVIDPPIPFDAKLVLKFIEYQGSIPPDPDEYPRAIKDAVSVVFEERSVLGFRRRRRVLSVIRSVWNIVEYLLDRWVGLGEFRGYGALEAAMRDDALTELVLPQVIGHVDYRVVPRTPYELLELIRQEELESPRRWIAVSNMVRMPTNVVIPPSLSPFIVKKLLPSLTLDKPFQTREDPVYRARIAADLIKYNVNIRKMRGVPMISPKLLRPYIDAGKTFANHGGAGSGGRNLRGIELLAALSIAMEAHYTIIFSGGMGSGKTTQLNLLTYLLRPDYQLVVVERGAQEFLVPLDGQVLSITVPSEDKLMQALDQALRYGTMKTIIALAEARTREELRILINYKLTGHGGLTTMHSQSIREAIMRIVDSGAQPEALNDTVVVQLGVVGGERVVKETALIRVVDGEVISTGLSLEHLDDYCLAEYGHSAAKEVELRVGVIKQVMKMGGLGADNSIELAREMRKMVVEQLFLDRLSEKYLSYIDNVAPIYGYSKQE